MVRQPAHRLTTTKEAKATPTTPNKKRKIGFGIAAGSTAVALAAFGLPALAAQAAPVTYSNDKQIVSDTLDRVQQNGWGSAPVGGAYTVSSPTAFSANGATGVAAVPRPGASLTASLPSATATDADISTVVSIPTLPTTGNGVYAGVQLRSAKGSYYQATARIDAKARLLLSVSRINGSTADQTTIAAEKVVAQNVTAGQKIAIDFRVTGTDTVSTTARAWLASQTAPDWQVSGTDATAKKLTAAGSVGLWSYVSGSSAATAVSFDNVSAYSLKAVQGGQPTQPDPTQTATPTPTPTETTAPTEPTKPTPPPSRPSRPSPLSRRPVTPRSTRARHAPAPVRPPWAAPRTPSRRARTSWPPLAPTPCREAPRPPRGRACSTPSTPPRAVRPSFSARARTTRPSPFRVASS
ncbi:hypothetical protein [Leifsonia poae]|uniref:hypothetical protein n=1 Tax=Leifsonia poae TaxID=110933 RepID=UPI003D66EB9F